MFPQVIKDDLTLEANHYRIRIGQEIVAEDKIFPQLLLAIPGDNTQTKIEGTMSKIQILTWMQLGLSLTSKQEQRI